MTFRLEGHEHRVSIVSSGDSLECDACDRSSGDGFSCSECKFTVHRKCAFVFMTEDIFHHPSHDGHCLKLLTTGAPVHTDSKCHLCGKNTKHLLYHCYDCKVNLDIDCMIDGICTLARLSKPWHPHLLLMVDFSSDMWCDFCYEGGKHGYFCPRCRYAKPGGKINGDYELLANNSSSRPLCSTCHCRCPGPFILNKERNNIFFCSYYCLGLSREHAYSSVDMCPPWAI
ncbi:unnamed protein product [Arabidopsis thaliana]|uniref:(thale cress) hypothetical protein n=1 Tax=Arabidopsis thaliana TaxID=3702 RepID=A0A7G2ET67_ARATH|nr:unnamed protein product [Arabidopsis thaliana]